jgi:DHA1 family inner membrane transport protein
MPLPLLGLFLAAFAVGTTEFIIAGLLPSLAADLGVDIPTAGLLISGYASGVAIGGPILAIVFGNFPRRTLLLGLMVVFVAGNALCAVSASYWMLMGARLVISCSHGLFFGVALVIASRLVPVERQKSALSLVIAGITVANVLGVPLGTAIGNAFGWRASFWAIVAIGVVATVVLVFLVPRDPASEAAKAETRSAEIKAVFRVPVLLAYLMIALMMTAYFGVFAYVVPILTEVSGVPVQYAPWILFLSGVGGIFGNLLGGRIGDWKPLPGLVVVFALLVVLSLVLLFAIHSQVGMAIVVVLWSLIGFSFAAPAQGLVMKGAADAPNLASTLISTAFNVGIAFGAWLGGTALSHGWQYAQLPWIATVYLTGALLVAIFSLLRSRGVDSPALAE